jgi:hypothetical protein
MRVPIAILMGILGAVMAQLLSGFCLWLLGGASNFSPLGFVLYSFLGPFLVGIGAGLISIAFNRNQKYINVGCLAFIVTLLSLPSAALIDIYVLDDLLSKLHNLTLFRIYAGILQMLTGFLLMGILTAFRWMLTHWAKVDNK